MSSPDLKFPCCGRPIDFVGRNGEPAVPRRGDVIWCEDCNGPIIFDGPAEPRLPTPAEKF
jgi:hypothetical protein